MTFKSGFVTILGRPNVGKSTLLNKLLKQKVSIVSPKPQTTRNKITGILNNNDYQVVFLDTPGIHKPKNQLDEYMERSIKTSTDGVDLILFLLDGTKPFKEEDIDLVRSYSKGKIPVILVINKTDDTTMEALYPKLAKLNSLKEVKEIIPLSAKTGKNTDVLLENILKYLPEGPLYYPQDVPTDKTEIFLAGEIIREKSLWLLNEEIPHGVAVVINSFTEHNDMAKLDATIICEKENHKRIIIGKDGSKLKEIAEKARREMEALFNKKIFLSIWVKVKERWRDSDFQVQDLGYDKNKL